jgi:hypothetical protein
MSDESLMRLRELWSAFGSARNPDDFKPSVQDAMWKMALTFARESTVRAGSIYRENQALRETLAALDSGSTD